MKNLTWLSLLLFAILALLITRAMGQDLSDREVTRSSKTMYTWVPTYTGGFNLGVCKEGYLGNLNFGVSLIGYGQSKTNLDWRFIQLGLDLSPKFDSIGVNLTPILYRPMSKMAPNTSFGPGIGYGTKGMTGFINGSIKF